MGVEGFVLQDVRADGRAEDGRQRMGLSTAGAIGAQDADSGTTRHLRDGDVSAEWGFDGDEMKVVVVGPKVTNLQTAVSGRLSRKFMCDDTSPD